MRPGSAATPAGRPPAPVGGGRELRVACEGLPVAGLLAAPGQLAHRELVLHRLVSGQLHPGLQPGEGAPAGVSRGVRCVWGGRLLHGPSCAGPPLPKSVAIPAHASCRHAAPPARHRPRSTSAALPPDLTRRPAGQGRHMECDGSGAGVWRQCCCLCAPERHRAARQHAMPPQDRPAGTGRHATAARQARRRCGVRSCAWVCMLPLTRQGAHQGRRAAGQADTLPELSMVGHAEGHPERVGALDPGRRRVSRRVMDDGSGGGGLRCAGGCHVGEGRCMHPARAHPAPRQPAQRHPSWYCSQLRIGCGPAPPSRVTAQAIPIDCPHRPRPRPKS
jgi:hypothetical protein